MVAKLVTIRELNIFTLWKFEKLILKVYLNMILLGIPKMLLTIFLISNYVNIFLLLLLLWSYIKHYLEKSTKKLPTFDKSTCYEFFKKAFSCFNPNERFRIPFWIPSFSPPVTPFDSNPPTYAEISQIIKRMKTSGSPCPLDQISIICYKRCPYLRSYLTAIIGEIWKKKNHNTDLEKSNHYSYSQER